MPLGPVIATITINLHQTGHVTSSFPENAGAMMAMLAGFLQSIQGRLEYKKESRIIQVPPGARVKEPQK
jgi:hypothetical protein